MARLKWHETGQKLYEYGVDRGVLYIPDETGDYEEGHAWNGLTAVNESPSGAEANPQYADNVKYLTLYSAEEFGATIEAFTYPEAFAQCDGTASPATGVYVGQQIRRSFGFSYRTRIGNDVREDLGYKIHLVFGAKAAPTEKSRSTVNDSPEATNFSWELTTDPVEVPGLDKPTAHLSIVSTEVDATDLAAFEAILYGDETNEPRLPSPTEVIEHFGGVVNPENPG